MIICKNRNTEYTSRHLNAIVRQFERHSMTSTDCDQQTNSIDVHDVKRFARALNFSCMCGLGACDHLALVRL